MKAMSFGGENHSNLVRLHVKIRRLDVSGKKLLLPRMTPFGTRLLAAAFRAFGVDAHVMPTYKGVNLGKEFTSGKECFPCQVTLGDVLHYLIKEKERLGGAFDPTRYVYFLPESDGPCRFGMYNKFQRLVLDRFPEYKEIPITYLSTEDSYSVAGLLPPDRARHFRRVAYVSAIVADVFDRIVWRVRPYEIRSGITDRFMERAVTVMERRIQRVGARRDFRSLLDLVADVALTARGFIDDRLPRKPRIGIVGEIYLRTHPESNQNIVRKIESYGGEVVDASIGEWLNFVAKERARKLARRCRLAWVEGRNRDVLRYLGGYLRQGVENLYQGWRMGQVYRRALAHLDIQKDHTVREIQRCLDGGRHFNFDVGTEAVLSIGGALSYLEDGFDGIVNVYPFTCMPSTISSAVLRPLLHARKIPYLDAPYDGTVQPNREIALQTFIYQARQHRDIRMKKRVEGRA